MTVVITTQKWHGARAASSFLFFMYYTEKNALGVRDKEQVSFIGYRSYMSTSM